MNEENFYSGIRNKDETVLDTAMAYYKPLFYKVGFDLLYPVGTYEDVSDCITDTSPHRLILLKAGACLYLKAECSISALIL